MLRSSTLSNREEVVQFSGFKFSLSTFITVGIVEICSFLILTVIIVVDI